MHIDLATFLFNCIANLRENSWKMIIIPKITRQMHGNDSENDKEMTKINLSAKAQ